MEPGDREWLRDVLMRMLRGLGAGVIKSFTCSPLERGEACLLDVEFVELDMRTTLGAGLPVEWSCGEEVRNVFPCLGDVEKMCSLLPRLPL